MSYPSTDLAGSTICLAAGGDVVLGKEDAPTRVFNMHIVSGGTGGVVILRNGDAVGDTAWVTESGTANTGKTIDYGHNGILFPDGVFVDIDGNVTSVVITYSQ